MTVNNMTNWNIVWLQIKDESTREIVESVNCMKLILSWSDDDVNKSERVAILAEIDSAKDSLCPNVTSFEIWGRSYPVKSYFQVSVSAKTDN